MKSIFIIFLLSINAYSHPGTRSKHDDCHFCYKDCSKFNLTDNTRHSHSNNKCDPKKGPVDKQKYKTHHKKSNSKYNRKFFHHWVDYDGDCRNRRSEILSERSLKAVTYKKNKNGKECTVLTGLWNDYFYPETLVHSSEIDIDHIVPLKEAWITGANKWSAKRREQFANDPENLVVTNKKYNRQKGAQTPLTWTPLHREYTCKYINQWIVIKRKYKLQINSKIYQYQENARCKQ